MVVDDLTLRASWVSSSPFSSTVIRLEYSVRAVEMLATLSAVVIAAVGGGR